MTSSDDDQGPKPRRRRRSKAESAAAPKQPVESAADSQPPATLGMTIRDALSTRNLSIAALSLALVGLVVAVATVIWLEWVVGPRNDNRLLILAAAQLEAQVINAEPYGATLAAIDEIAPYDAVVSRMLAPLRRSAAGGTSSMPRLRRQLDLVATEILFVTALPRDDGLWIDNALIRLASAARLPRIVRRLDGQNPASEIAGAARGHMRRGELEQAFRQIERLDGQAREIATPWLRSARARLSSLRAAGALRALARERW